MTYRKNYDPRFVPLPITPPWPGPILARVKRGRLLLASGSETDWIALNASLAESGVDVALARSLAESAELLEQDSFDGLAVDILQEEGVDLLLHARLRHPRLTLCVVGRVRDGRELYKATFPGDDDMAAATVTAGELAARIARLVAFRRGADSAEQQQQGA